MQQKGVQMNRFRLAACVCLWLAVGLGAQSENEKDLRAEFHRISSHDILGYVQELTSEKYGGRLTGTPEYRRAAEWVAARLREWGVQPAGDNGTFFLEFPAPYTTVDSPGSVSITGSSGTRQLRFPDDYFPGSNSASGEIDGELVYAGFGITAPALKYDDYRKLNVRGKVVLVESGAPYEQNDETLAHWADFSGSFHKTDNAFRHGAAGIVFMERVANPATPYHEKFMSLHIDKKVAEELLAATGRDKKALRDEIAKTFQPRSFATGMRIRLTARTTRHPEGVGCTVAGLLPGSDPALKAEVLIVGAHLDHVGFIGTLFPGALDNASGCANVLAAARALGQSKIARKRSILFLFFGGEETGLHGSSRYVENPVFPKEKTRAFFNLDMVGNGSGLALGSGLTYAKVGTLFSAVNERWIHRPLRLSERRNYFGRARSDGAVFAKAGYPALSIGTTNAEKPVYYHDPRDTWDMLCPEIMEDAARLLFLGLSETANADL
jgi:hypothetical protein